MADLPEAEESELKPKALETLISHLTRAAYPHGRGSQADRMPPGFKTSYC